MPEATIYTPATLLPLIQMMVETGRGDWPIIIDVDLDDKSIADIGAINFLGGPDYGLSSVAVEEDGDLQNIVLTFHTMPEEDDDDAEPTVDDTADPIDHDDPFDRLGVDEQTL